MKYHSKSELVADIRVQRDALDRLIGSIPRSRYEEGGVWGDGWSIKDLVAHLGAWHALFLRWWGEGLEAKAPDLPAPGFKWNETPALNRKIRLEQADRRWDDVWSEFEATHATVLAIAEESSEGELMEPGHFAWTGPNPLRTYLAANTASHYRFAVRVLKRWLRNAA